MERGSILHWPGFIFHDGCKSNKYVIILSNTSKENVAMVTVTSKQHRRSTLPNCQVEPLSFFFPVGSVPIFTEDTWVVLDSQPYVTPTTSVQSRIDSGELKEVHVLSESIVNAIRNCLVTHSRLLTQKNKKLLRG